jgi:hypothetical protein
VRRQRAEHSSRYREDSKYYASLAALNGRLTATGNAPAAIRDIPGNLEDDDVLVMVNAGIVPVTVVDAFLAHFGFGTAFGNMIEKRYLVSAKYAKRATSEDGRKKYSALAGLFQKYGDQYFKDEPMDPLNKGQFAFASYNAGPGRIRQLRREAEKRGLDPNVWFGNVEQIASERIGRETVTYVSNIYRYYIAYRLLIEERDRRDATKAAMKTGVK